MNILFEEIKEDEVYVFNYKEDIKDRYIGIVSHINKNNRECISKNYIYVDQQKYSTSGSFRFNEKSTVNQSSKCECLRIATNEEKVWLNACIKADRFIPLEEVNYSHEPVYSIY